MLKKSRLLIGKFTIVAAMLALFGVSYSSWIQSSAVPARMVSGDKVLANQELVNEDIDFASNAAPGLVTPQSPALFDISGLSELEIEEELEFITDGDNLLDFLATNRRLYTSPVADTELKDSTVIEKEEHDHDDVIIAYEPVDELLVNEFATEAPQNPPSFLGFQSVNLGYNNRMEPNQDLEIELPDNIDDRVFEHITIEPEINGFFARKGRSIIVPYQALTRDTEYTIGVQTNTLCTKEIETYCTATNEDWAYKVSFLSPVRTEKVFGKSVRGQDIKGYYFGKCDSRNCTKIMLTGGLHGSEWRSGDLTRLVRFLTQNPHEISGQDKEFLIMPFTNPDGTALNIRYNANGVNLNRNFGTGWRACPQCGPYLESEPETKTIMDATYAFRPDYLISYHAQWPPDGIIFRGSDFNPKTINFANYVADKTGYPVGYFPDFDVVPGDQTVWAEARGVSSIIIEATYVENSDWNKNFNLYLSLLRDDEI